MKGENYKGDTEEKRGKNERQSSRVPLDSSTSSSKGPMIKQLFSDIFFFMFSFFYFLNFKIFNSYMHSQT